MLRNWFSAHRSLVATATSGALIAAVVATIAIVSTGYTAQKMELDDASVWVANGSQQVIGRANTEVFELNSVVACRREPAGDRAGRRHRSARRPRQCDRRHDRPGHQRRGGHHRAAARPGRGVPRRRPGRHLRDGNGRTLDPAVRRAQRFRRDRALEPEPRPRRGRHRHPERGSVRLFARGQRGAAGGCHPVRRGRRHLGADDRGRIAHLRDHGRRRSVGGPRCRHPHPVPGGAIRRPQRRDPADRRAEAAAPRSELRPAAGRHQHRPDQRAVQRREPGSARRRPLRDERGPARARRLRVRRLDRRQLVATMPGRRRVGDRARPGRDARRRGPDVLGERRARRAERRPQRSDLGDPAERRADRQLGRPHRRGRGPGTGRERRGHPARHRRGAEAPCRRRRRLRRAARADDPAAGPAQRLRPECRCARHHTDQRGLRAHRPPRSRHAQPAASADPQRRRERPDRVQLYDQRRPRRHRDGDREGDRACTGRELAAAAGSHHQDDGRAGRPDLDPGGRGLGRSGRRRLLSHERDHRGPRSGQLQAERRRGVLRLRRRRCAEDRHADDVRRCGRGQRKPGHHRQRGRRRPDRHRTVGRPHRRRPGDHDPAHVARARRARDACG